MVAGWFPAIPIHIDCHGVILSQRKTDEMLQLSKSKIFNLNLREIRDKSEINFRETYPSFPFVLPYIRFLKSQNLKVRENKYTRKFVRAKICTNKVH